MMRMKAVGTGICGFIGLCALCGPAAAAPIPVTGDPVLFWAELLSNSQAGSPVPSSRGIAMVSVALHDAVNATLGNPNNSYLRGVATQGGDTRAASSVAARDILVQLFPAKAADYDAALQQQLALVPEGEAKTRGIATGAAIASAMLGLRANDGATAVVPHAPAPPGTPGHWQPTPPANAPFAFTQWGQVDTWLIDSGDQFRPGPPPALDSAEYAASFNEVKELGSATSATRTADQTAAAQFWATNTGSPLLRLAIALADEQGLSTLDNARLLALFSSVVADAAIATWDAKFHYDFWRPITAIQNADVDGNADTIADPNWQPLIVNPPYPGYTSGIIGVAGSGALALQELLGNDFGFCVPHPVTGTPERCYDNFDDLINELTLNRIWAGIHFDFDMFAGLGISRNVAAFAFASPFFDAVPEPGMLGLFGLGASALIAAGRQRRRPKPVR